MHLFKLSSLSVAGATIAALLVTGCGPSEITELQARGSCERGRPAPAFTGTSPSQWVNSAPVKMSSLKGKVVLIDIWTFACWNCYRSFPWLNGVQKKYEAKGLQIIGIHSPEFARERVKRNVAKHIKKYKLNHPVMMDNDFAYWKKLGNRYWPAFYLVDKKGCLRYVHVGETHSGTFAARKVEAMIEKLLKEG